jgi:hypothetical protein
MTMNYADLPQEQQSNAWVLFSCATFAVAVLMFAIGLVYLPLEPWVKAYFAMGAILLIQACFTLAKTLRDRHEERRFVNRIDTARTEKLLRDTAQN